MKVSRLLLLLALLIPAPVLAVDVRRIRGGCDVAAVHRLVRQWNSKLARCAATGPVVLHVAPDGRVERVDATPAAKPCWKARTAKWRVPMREAGRCTVEVGTP